MAIDPRSEEEKKKRREQFERNQSALGLGANSKQAGILGAGRLPQQQATPAQQQMRNSAQAQQQARAQSLGQSQAAKQAQQSQQQQSKSAALSEAQAIARMPVNKQAPAVEKLRQQGAASQASPQPKQPFKSTSAPGDTAISTTQASKNGVSNQMEGMGMQLGFPSTGSKGNGEDQWNPRDYPQVHNPNPIQPTARPEPIAQIYTEQQQPARMGFNPVSNTQSTIPVNGNFGMPAAPRKAYGEDSRRAALAMDIKPYAKMGGRLTSKQIALKNSIMTGDDEKYANERYAAQLGASSQVAKSRMEQEGANSRAELGEFGSNNRFNSQLGFDANKFQQTVAQQQQSNALDERRLGLAQENQDVQNFAPKQLNALYERYDAAKTDDDRTVIAQQIQALKGTGDKSDSEYWTSISGGERVLDADTGATEKLPDILLNRNTGETRTIPTEPIDYSTDPRAQAIINDRSLSKEERRKQLEALG